MNFSELMNNGSKKIGEIAKDIAGSKYAKAIIPGKENLLNEANSFINNTNKTSMKLRSNEINKQMFNDITDTVNTINEMSLNPLDINKRKIKNITSMMNNTNYSSEAFSKMNKALVNEGINNDIADALINKFQQNSSTILNSKLNVNDYNRFTKASIYTKAYFNNPENKNIRIGTAIGAYAGLSIGSRYLSGGTLTTNNSGQKDIAGIPFI